MVCLIQHQFSMWNGSVQLHCTRGSVFLSEASGKTTFAKAIGDRHFNERATNYSSFEGTVLMPMKKAEQRPDTLMANLGDLNRPLRVRPVNVMGRDWWAVDPEDTWAGMVMDLRRLGFEAMAWENEVLVREGAPAYEPQMEGPAGPEGLRPFPVLQATIQIHKDPYSDAGYPMEYGVEDEDESEDITEPDEDLLHE